MTPPRTTRTLLLVAGALVLAEGCDECIFGTHSAEDAVFTSSIMPPA